MTLGEVESFMLDTGTPRSFSDDAAGDTLTGTRTGALRLGYASAGHRR